jgi:hypothetical protein
MRTAAVKARFDNIQVTYNKFKQATLKASALGKSGSGAQKAKQPTPFKYAAEAAFLDAVLKVEATVECNESP